jgi:hypothetical protein
MIILLINDSIISLEIYIFELIYYLGLLDYETANIILNDLENRSSESIKEIIKWKKQKNISKQ